MRINCNDTIYTIIFVLSFMISARMQVGRQIMDKTSASATSEEGDTLNRPALPVGSYLPFLRNPNFLGRQEELDSIYKAYFESNADRKNDLMRFKIIAGEAGVGKTDLAIEACYRFRHSFDSIHWIQADRDLSTEISVCGEPMSLPDWPQTIPEKASRTLQAWRGDAFQLIILDHVENPCLVTNWPWALN